MMYKLKTENIEMIAYEDDILRFMVAMADTPVSDLTCIDLDGFSIYSSIYGSLTVESVE